MNLEQFLSLSVDDAWDRFNVALGAYVRAVSDNAIKPSDRHEEEAERALHEVQRIVSYMLTKMERNK